ncbi:MAG: dienelactone hydrolase family protein [Alphaproteobacteria bacterium]
MAGQDIEIKGVDGAFGGYLATPASGSGPGLVVIQEIFGVNQVMRQITEMYADAGYVALCPDLFWRQQPGIQITDQSKEEWDQAFALYQGFDVDKGIADIDATITTLRNMDGCTGKVGSTGYCLGGLLAYLTACRTSAEASVGYYGVGIEGRLGEAQNMNGFCMLHIAEEDGFCPKEAQAQIRDDFDKSLKVTVHTYPGMDHAFCRYGGEHFDQENCDLANRRTLDFFKQHLG